MYTSSMGFCYIGCIFMCLQGFITVGILMYVYIFCATCELGRLRTAHIWSVFGWLLGIAIVL